MKIKSPQSPRLAVLYIRSGPDIPGFLNPKAQEEACRRYCRDNHIPVSHSIRVHCGAKDSLDYLKTLLSSLPGEVDVLFALRFFCYSTRLPQLAELCLQYQHRHVWLCSLDVEGPLYRTLQTLLPGEYQRAEQLRE